MPWGIAVGAVVGAGGAVYSADKASDAAGKAADAQAAGQREGLEYQQEREKIPTFYRTAALRSLGDYYGTGTDSGLDGAQSAYDEAVNAHEDAQANYDATVAGRSRRSRRKIDKSLRPGLLRAEHEMEQAQGRLTEAQEYQAANPHVDRQTGRQRMIDDVRQSPFFNSLLTQGEEAVARNAGVTGGLRSGNANEAFEQNSQNVLRGLVNERVRGLQSMAGLPSNTNAIAGSMAGIGATEGQGIVAQGQIKQQGWQNASNAIGMGMKAYANRPVTPQQPQIGQYTPMAAPSQGYDAGYGQGASAYYPPTQQAIV